jgi:hypothetical protein
LSYPICDHLNAYGGFSASRLYLTGKENAFFKFFDTTFGLWRGQQVCKPVWLYCGYQLDWRPSSPSEFTRVDNAGYVGANLALLRKLTLQLLYRLRVQEYLQANRTDIDHLLSAALVYAFNDYVSVRAITEYGDNESDVPGLDYHVFSAGGGLNLSVRF